MKKLCTPILRTLFCGMMLLFMTGMVQATSSCCPKFKLHIPELCEPTDTACFNHSALSDVQYAEGCKGTTKKYTVYPNLPGYTYTWTVNGGTPTSFVGNPINITWGMGASASIKVVVSQNNGSCKDSFMVSLCLKDAPMANFTAPDTVCNNSPIVTFVNTSIGGASYTWDFGDGTSYTGVNPPIHTYPSSPTPQMYIVTLTASNNPLPSGGGSIGQGKDCYCTDTHTDTVWVIAGTGPVITPVGCVGSLCASTVPLVTSYTTSTICGSYVWTVTGGTITSGGGTNTITVLWNPTYYGTPTVTLTIPPSCSGLCGASTTITVPIIYPTMPIMGPNTVCVNSTNTYSIPVLTGCYTKWKIINVTSGATFTLSSNPYNSTSVSTTAFSYPGTYILQCKYYDSLKMCGGIARDTITVLPKLFITTFDNQVCQGSSGLYNANTAVIWKVYQNGTLINTYPTATSVSIPWTIPGTYSVVAILPTASLGLYCNDSASTIVVVVAKPVLTTAQPLSNTICPGDIRQYQVSSTKPDFPYTWAFTPAGAGTILSNNDNKVIVHWNSAGSLAVFQTNPSLNCPSNTITFTTTLYAAPSFTGATTACEDDVVTYTASPTGMPAYNWTVVGGSIVNQTANTVQILWAGGPPTHTLKLSTCAGATTPLSVTVTNKIAYPITATIGTFCSSTLTSTATGASSYTWWVNGVLLAATTQTITPAISGYYTCLPIGLCAKASGLNVVLPTAPTVSISTPTTIYCAPGSITFNASISPPGTYTYQWYHAAPSPVLVGTGTSYTTPVAALSAAVVGNYYLVVTDVNSCTVSSNVIYIDTCGSGGGSSGCTLPSAPYSMTISSNCGTAFTASFSSTPPAGTTITWAFGDGGSTTSLAGGPGVTHNYASPGVYQVCATAHNATYCDITACINDTIFIVPNFTIANSCATSTLTDASTLFAGVTGYTIAWTTTGGTASPTTGSPTTYSTASGTATMTISYNGCTYPITKPVTITGTTVTINNPSPVCQYDVNAFSTTPSGFAVNNWTFGDSYTSSLAPTTHAYNTSNTFTVTVSVTDYYGCTATGSSSIIVNPLPTIVLTTADTFFCKGDSTLLTATPGMTTYSWYVKDIITQSTTLVVSGNNNTLYATSTGIYSVVVTDANGCSNTSNVMPAIEHPLPKTKITFVNPSSSIICVSAGGGSTAVTTPYDANYTYLWSADAPLTVTFPNNNQTQIIAPVGTSNGNYSIYLMVKDTTTGCVKYDTICVIVRQSPSVTIPALMLCAGMPTILTATPNNTVLYDYVWSHGPTTPSVSVSAAGSYTLTMTDKQSGCAATSNTVNINPLPDLSLFPKGCDTLCMGKHLYVPLPNMISVDNPPSVYPTIQWIVDGIPTIVGNYLPLNTLVPIPGSHTIKVIVTNSFGCTDSSTIYNVYVDSCNPCCALTSHIDSVHCNGNNEYQVYLNVKGCGKLIITNNTGGYISVASPVTLTSTATTIPVIINTTDSHVCLHLQVLDSTGFLCRDTVICDTFTPCPPKCCSLTDSLDSIVCVGNDDYHVYLRVKGCGRLIITNSGGGVVTVTNPIILTGAMISVPITIHTSTAFICLHMQVYYNSGIDSGKLCKDTTICKQFQPCPAPCCSLTDSIDSVVCKGNNTYQIYLRVKGCGRLEITNSGGGVLSPVITSLVLSSTMVSVPLTITTTNAFLCLRMKVYLTSGIDSGLQCKDTTICKQFKPCPSSCCSLDSLKFSYTCVKGVYQYSLSMSGCGRVVINPVGNGIYSKPKPNAFYLSTTPTLVTGTAQTSDTLLCFTILLYDTATHTLCHDTTICFHVQPCTEVPCSFKKSWCRNQLTYTYTGPTAGLTFNWTFPGGTPPAATGNPVTVIYNPPYYSIVKLVIKDALGNIVGTCYDTLRSRRWYVDTAIGVVLNGHVLIAQPDTSNDVDSLSYQWYVNDTTPIKGATERFYVPTKSGVYTCRVSPIDIALPYDPYPCGWPTSKYNYIATGVVNISADEWAVFPNPSATKCTVVLGNGVHEPTQLRVLDALGAEIYTTTLDAGTSKATIDVSSMASGVYQIMVSSSGFHGVKRLVVQHD